MHKNPYKDHYNFEFLGLSGEVAERDLENAHMVGQYALRQLGSST